MSVLPLPLYTTTPRRSSQDGLEWVQEFLGPEPRWTREPSIEAAEQIARKHLRIGENESCAVDFFASGAFNKLYRIESPSGSFLLRVALPVDPHRKTRSEVATILFLKEKTRIPVPGIVAFDDNNENELGFEWILMELMPGAPLRSRWRKISMDAKLDLVKCLARYQAQMFNSSRFKAIGNIYVHPKKPLQISDIDLGYLREKATEFFKWSSAYLPWSPKTVVDSSEVSQTNAVVHSGFYLGPIVSLIFLRGDHVHQDVSHGPFLHAHDWLKARLLLTVNDQAKIIKQCTDEGEIEDAEYAKNLTERLLSILPEFFPIDPENCNIPEKTVLIHSDLNDNNILVNDNGEIAAIVDWECVSAVPQWLATEVPKFLYGKTRNETPNRDIYADESEAEDDASENCDPNVPDSEGKCEMYWEHLMEFEQTQLRPVYIEELNRLWPRYEEIKKEGTRMADLEMAVGKCEGGWGGRAVTEWLDSVAKGEYWSMKEKYL